MKLIVIKGNLKEGLAAVEKTSGDNQNLPILKNVFLETTQNNIKLTTTNLEMAMSYYALGKTIESGRVTVPISLFLNIINNLQSERLNLEKKNNNLEIKTDNYEAVIQGLPAEEFPLIPKIKSKESRVEMAGAVFQNALAQTAPSTQFSELRPELGSILVDFSLDSIKLAATDSFRLSEKTIPSSEFTTNHTEPFRFLVPLRTAHELLRNLKEDKPLTIHHDENQTLFVTDQFELISRLVQGTFPDYQSIVPRKLETEIVLSREDFINALRLAAVFSSRVHEIRVKVHEGKKSIEVFSADQILGENKYLLPAKIQGKSKEASFNWRYLLDGLKAVRGEEVFLGLGEENKPALLKSPTDASYFYVLMPILKI